MSEPAPRAIGKNNGAKAQAIRFFRLAAGLLFAAIGAIAFAVRFEIFGAGFHVNFALLLGIAGTILLGVGLMALTFYSDRSGADDSVVNLDRHDGEDGQDPNSRSDPIS